MEKIVEQALLYDFYGELLTSRQKEIYEEIVFNDLSLSEAAQEYGISRQGIHDMIRRSDKSLRAYEEKLQLLRKFLRTSELADEILKGVARYRESGEAARLQEIEEAAKQIQALL